MKVFEEHRTGNYGSAKPIALLRAEDADDSLELAGKVFNIWKTNSNSMENCYVPSS
jgi:hypothetical protein